MKRLLLLIGLSGLVSGLIADPTDLDTAFSGFQAGYGYAQIATERSSSVDLPTPASSIQSDGKIITAGTFYDGSKNNIIVARYLVAGVLDYSFGTIGKVTTAIIFTPTTSGQTVAADTKCTNAVIDEIGRIVVTGIISATNLGAIDYVFVARYTSAGVLDATFNPSGLVNDSGDTPITNYTMAPGTALLTSVSGYSKPVTTSVVIDGSGNIVIGGYAADTTLSRNHILVARFTTNGLLDITFNLNREGDNNSAPGFILYSVPVESLSTTGLNRSTTAGNSIAIDANQNIVVPATTFITNITGNTQAAVIRFTSLGTPDITFNNGQEYALLSTSSTITTTSASFQGVAIQPDGGIVLSGNGYVGTGTIYQPLLARYFSGSATLAGTWDPTFNANGTPGYVITVIPSNTNGTFEAAIIEPTGKIVVNGMVTESGQNHILLARYHADGTLDTALNPLGYIIFDNSYIPNATNTFTKSVGVQTDGKYTLGGMYYSSVTGTPSYILTLRYLGGNQLEFITAAIDEYGVNQNLFQQFLYVTTYAQVITDSTAQTAAINRINAIFTAYGILYQNQVLLTPDFNYVSYLYLNNVALDNAKVVLTTAYPSSADQIIEFIDYLKERIVRLTVN